MGSRYGGLKQMDAVGPRGEILLEYSVFDAICAGFGKIVFVIRSDFSAEFKERIGTRFSDQIDVDYIFQSLDNLAEGFRVPEGRTKPWGTAHAILACPAVVDEPFVVQNAADYYGAEAYQVVAEKLMKLSDEETCMVGNRIRNTLSENGSVSGVICVATDGVLTGVIERPNIAMREEGGIVASDGSIETRLDGGDLCSMNF